MSFCQASFQAARRSCRHAVAIVFALALTLVAVGARAQSITVSNPTSLPRLTAEGKAVNKRPLLTPEGVSLQDCFDNQYVRFTLQLAGTETGASIKAWASASSGQDCGPSTSRSGTVQTCWQIGPENNVQPTINYDIPVRTIMAGASTNGSSGTPGTPVNPDLSENICGKVQLTTISVQFMYFAPGDPQNAVTGKTLVVPIKVDTIGPDPPTGITHLPGNKRIKVTWTNISGGDPDAGTTGGSTTLTGINVYCDKSTTEVAAAPVCTDEPLDASADAADLDAGTVQVCVDGGTTSVACGSSNLSNADGTPLQPSAELGKFLCKSIAGNTGTSATTESILENNVAYAVAVGATDDFGNVGPLSPVVCETPEETTDFWDDYRKAGGAAGGGCATGGTDAPLGTAAALAGGVALAIASFTRRRKRR